ncbi:MAG: metallophosphatase family protein [Christensenellaceae bacterium]|nr:metallophosphatase family protein [Christensenellaceae bacterium]
MTRAAFIADAHGNLPALEAVLADIRQKGIEKIYFLGDLIGKGPDTSKILGLVRQSCAGVVYGNWDRLISSDYAGHGGPWFRERLSAGELEYLRALPRDLCLNLDGHAVRAYHGRFTIDEVVMPYSSLASIQKAMDAVGPSEVTIMADAHHPFMLMLGGRMLVNTGSVGNPCDRVAKASYFALSIEGERIEGSHVRLPYDIERAVRLAEEAENLPMKGAYIEELRSARYSSARTMGPGRTACG